MTGAEELERLKKELALRKDNQYAFEYMLDSSDFGVIALSPKGETAYVNLVAGRMFGMDAGGGTVKDMQGLWNALAEKCADGPYEFSFAQGKEGRVYRVRQQKVSIGRYVDHTLMFVYDVTDTVREAQERRDLFVNSSHSLKTPITAILGFSELLSGGMVKDPDKAAEYVGRIYNQAREMAGTIDDIIRLNVIDVGSPPAPARPHDISELAGEAADTFRDAARLGSIELKTELSPAMLVCDGAEMKQMICNLIDNAVKYTPPGGRVTVFAGPERGRAVIRVSDTGIGIPEAGHGRIFDRFYRSDAVKSRYPGSGLGLSIVKHTVTRMRGELSLRSEPGRGTEITAAF